MVGGRISGVFGYSYENSFFKVLLVPDSVTDADCSSSYRLKRVALFLDMRLEASTMARIRHATPRTVPMMIPTMAPPLRPSSSSGDAARLSMISDSSNKVYRDLI